jgi:mono/diheme cytochrome c family protein
MVYRPRSKAVRLPVLTLLLATLLCPDPASAQSSAEAQARRLLNSQGCKACHLFDGDGGSAGPDLSKIGSRLSQEQLRSLLVNRQRRHAAGRMADFSHLQDEEIDALVTFLSQRQ